MKLIFLFLISALGQAAMVQTGRIWHLRSDGLTQADTVSIQYDSTELTVKWMLQINDQAPIPLDMKVGNRQLHFSADQFEAGHHQVKMFARDAPMEATQTEFIVSYPLYVTVSTDWDDTRTGNRVLGYVDSLHQKFPNLRMTHFFAPYHYTDPQLSKQRKQEIDRFIKRQRDQNGDEIGVHIHGWCHFINTTGVPCKTKESFYVDDGTGYTEILASYSLSDMTQILESSVQMFAKQGLGRPTSFRAGGWTADNTVLKALDATGFIVDASAVPAYRLSSWKGYALYDWNMEHWKGITETTQPYHFEGLSLLEVPDNGVLVDYVSSQDMIQIYDWNQPQGEALSKPTVYQIGFHPVDSFSKQRYQHMVETLQYVEKHAYLEDLGPAKYATLTQMTSVFK